MSTPSAAGEAMLSPMQLLPLLAQNCRPAAPATPRLWVVLVVVLLIVVFALFVVMLTYGKLWFQAYMSNARVSMFSLIGMSLRQVNARVIVQAKIMAMQAGVGTDPHTGITTRRLEAHYLAGGNVPGVINAIIAAHRADIDLDFDRAAAIDLAGRDVLDAVRTSVYPKVIDCPDPADVAASRRSAPSPRTASSCKIRARVTVRTNLAQLIGGATEETIIARVGEGIITSIGSAESHLAVMENPDRISKAVLRPRARRAHGVRDRLDRHRRHRRGREHRRPAASRPGRGRHPRRPRQGRKRRARHRPRAGDEGQGRREPRARGAGRGRSAAGHGRGLSRRPPATASSIRPMGPRIGAAANKPSAQTRAAQSALRAVFGGAGKLLSPVDARFDTRSAARRAVRRLSSLLTACCAGGS